MTAAIVFLLGLLVGAGLLGVWFPWRDRREERAKTTKRMQERAGHMQGDLAYVLLNLIERSK